MGSTAPSNLPLEWPWPSSSAAEMKTNIDGFVEFGALLKAGHATQRPC
jgi:hypothetical protein